MKRSPAAALTRAELPEKPPAIAPPLPDIEAPVRTWVGSVGAALAGKDARIRELELCVARLESALLAVRGVVAREVEPGIDAATRALAPRRTT